MITKIPNINEILMNCLINDKFKFEAKLARNFVRISPEIVREKMSLNEHFM